MGNSQGSYELGTKKPIDENKNEEDSSLGMESCTIRASHITASSSTDEGPAFFGRLNGTKSWCAGSPADCFLEVDLDVVHYVTAVATQGNPIGNHDYVKNYKIQYSTNGMDWAFYMEDYKQVLEGNSDHNTAVKRQLEPNIKARYVRFWPTAWFQWPCLRVEIYGRPAPPENMTENGFVTFKVNAEERPPEDEESIEINDNEQDVPEQQTNKEELQEKINTNERESDEEKEFSGLGMDLDFLNDISKVTVEDEQLQNDVNVTKDISFRTLDTSTPAKATQLDVNKDVHENNDQVVAIKRNDADLKRLMEVKTKLEFEAEARKHNNGGEDMRKKKKRVTLEDEPPEYLHVPRRIHDAMWGDSPTNSLSEGLNNQEEKPLIEIQDGGAPLAEHDDDHIEESTDHQTPHSVTIRTVKTITTRIERHVGHNHVHEARDHEVHAHDERDHGLDHKDSPIICSTSADVSHDAPDDLFLSVNGFNNTTPYAAKASCEHLHPTDPVVQVAMESSFSERVDSMDQINIDALASRRFSGLDLLQSPYDAVSGEDIQKLLAWEDDTLPGWTRIKKSRDYEIFKGTAVDGGPPIIKAIITLKKIAYEEAVRRITDWKIRQEWDKTFDKITFIEQSYNFNVLHCSTKNQGVTLAVLDDVDIDEPYHASVWSVADHPDSYSLSTGKPLRYETMISGLVIRPTQDGFPSTQVTLLCQLKGSVAPPLKGTYLTGNPERWIEMLKKYSSPKKSHVKKVTI